MSQGRVASSPDLPQSVDRLDQRVAGGERLGKVVVPSPPEEHPIRTDFPGNRDRVFALRGLARAKARTSNGTRLAEVKRPTKISTVASPSGSKSRSSSGSR